MKKKDITVEELKTLFLARLKVNQTHNERLQECIQREFGDEFQKKEPEEVVAIKSMITEQISNVMARRLKAGRRARPLLSARDIMPFISQMIDAIEEKEKYKLEIEERKEFEGIVKKILENIVEMAITSEEDPYDEYWRWVKTVYGIAAERNIPPIELFAFENANDEITRRMYTREQFVAFSNKEMRNFIDADAVKKLIIEPMLDLLIRNDEEERHRIEQELEAELMPQLREILEKVKIVVKTVLDEEVARIYGAAV